MFFLDQDTLETKSRLYRYAVYLFSSLRPVRLSVWVGEGEPNPFVRTSLRCRHTHQKEIQDIFVDSFERH
jgi:hypothetical protein